MSDDYRLKIFYKGIGTVVYNEKIKQINSYEELRKKVVEKSNKSKNKEMRNAAVQSEDKFVLELEDKDFGIASIYDDRTLESVCNKMIEDKKEYIKVYIVKVDKYPEYKPPQIFKRLEDSLANASKEVIESIKKDLTQEELEKGWRTFIKEEKDKREVNDEIIKDMHTSIFCNNCQNGNFIGLRYVCAECNNFNLCEICYSNKLHTHCEEHTFIRIKNPIDLEINKYSCIFKPNKKIVNHNYEAFDLEVEVINNGIEDLQGCFISPIRFGKNYLGCNKTTITDKIETGEKTKIKTLVYFEDDNEKYYEGYFRLMTYDGIPFGDIFYLQVHIQG